MQKTRTAPDTVDSSLHVPARARRTLGDGRFVARYERHAEELSRAFAHDQAMGRVDPRRDPHTLGRLLLATWDGIQLQWLIDPAADMNRAMRAFFEWALPEAVEDAFRRAEPAV